MSCGCKFIVGEMVNKRRLSYLAGVLLLVLGLSLWQLPTLLKAMPSRYVARLPEPWQAMGERGDGEALLPTVAAPVAADADALLRQPEELPPPLTVTTVVPLTPIVTEMVVPTAAPFATPTNTPIPIPPALRLDGFQHQFQTWNNCGPATIAMALSYFGLNLSQQETAASLKPNPEDRNVSPYQMTAYVNEQTSYSALDRTNGDLETVKRLVADGFPVIIELGIEPPGEYRWLGWYGHYLLIVAYDDTLEQFWVYDSWFGTSDVPMENATIEGRVLSYAEADRQWQQFNRNYIVLFPPESETAVAAIIGTQMDDAIMWQNSYNRNRAALAKEPDNAFLWFNLGTTYNALGQFEEASTAYDQARAIGLPWRMLWYQFGSYEAYYQVGRYEDMIILADATLKDRPYFEEAYYYKGLALMAQGVASAALENFERAAKFNPLFQPANEAILQFGD